jgi:hypothetical protein
MLGLVVFRRLTIGMMVGVRSLSRVRMVMISSSLEVMRRESMGVIQSMVDVVEQRQKMEPEKPQESGAADDVAAPARRKL